MIGNVHDGLVVGPAETGFEISTATLQPESSVILHRRRGTARMQRHRGDPRPLEVHPAFVHQTPYL